MSSQAEGLIGRLVAGMIRRSVRTRFRNLYWAPSASPLTAPVIFYCNHHGWHDGYVMFHVVERLKLRTLDWIQEFDSFPLFAKVGGMRYASNDPVGRAKTIRRTIRLMNEEKRSLMLFAEGVLHRPPQIFPLGKSLQLLAEKVRGVKLVPTAIVYEQSMHERPEAWVQLGEPHEFESLNDCHGRLVGELDRLKARIAENEVFEVLAVGTGDVNERMSMKRFARP